MGRRSLHLLLSAIVISAVAGCVSSQPPGSFVSLSILNSLSLPTGYQGSGIAVSGSLAFISTKAVGSQNGARSLVIVSLQTPAAPAILSATSSGLRNDMAGIAVSGNYGYVPYESASGSNFQVWDISNAHGPLVVGSTSISCPAGMHPFQNPVLYENYVYVSCWESEVTSTGAIAIVDVSNPAALSVAGSVSVTAGYQPISFAIWEQNLYVAVTQGGATSDHVLLYSIADPFSPSLRATQPVPHSPQWVAAKATEALLPIYDGTELQVVDFSNPASPQAYSANLGSCHPMSVAVYLENLALVACEQRGWAEEQTSDRPALD